MSARQHEWRISTNFITDVTADTLRTSGIVAGSYTDLGSFCSALVATPFTVTTTNSTFNPTEGTFTGYVAQDNTFTLAAILGIGATLL